MKIENITDTKEKASSSSIIHCGSAGEFLYPSDWAQCSETVHCGQPPGKTENGTRTWLKSDEFTNSYSTEVVYTCVDGSQFDTDNDGVGDTTGITLSCLWSKIWTPWVTLPTCVITHCIFSFGIPAESFLEEVSTEWTPIETKKQFICQGAKDDGTHARFTEADRAVSTFSMLCNPYGNFMFKNKRSSWPTCLQGLKHILQACFNIIL